MAIFFITDKPAALLADFKKQIEQEEQKGKITTWEENKHGYFTHKADQVYKKAYFWPSIEKGRLAFYIRAPKGKPVNRYVFSFFHGHMTETMIAHCPKMFSKVTSTPNRVKGENVSGEYEKKP